MRWWVYELAITDNKYTSIKFSIEASKIGNIIEFNKLCILYKIKCILKIYCIFRGQSWRRGTRCDCKTNWLWVRSLLEEMKYLLKFIFKFLRSGVEVKRGVEFCHLTRTPEFGRKWGTECLNTRFPLPTLLCAGHSVKLIYLFILFYYSCQSILLKSIIMYFKRAKPWAGR